MDIKVIKEYKLKDERNNRPRRPVIWEDKIYLIFVYDKKGFTESRIQCLNLKSFELIWEFKISHVINDILISSEKTLIASCMNGIVLSFNLENGQEIWKFKTDESNIGSISNEYDKRIIFSGIQAEVTSTWCIDIQNGNILWKQPNSGHSYIPKIHKELIYNCIAKDIFCMNLKDGSLNWTQHESETYMFNPKIVNQYVVASGHGIVNMYDPLSGQQVMRIDTNEKSAIREIISDSENIYFGDEKGYFYSYNITQSDATLNWKITTEGSIKTIPALMHETIFVLNDASKLLCINKLNGETKNIKKTKGEGNISGITINDDKIYFSCGGGYLYECETK